MTRDIIPYCICGNKPCTGLDCGVYGPGEAPRKKPPEKTAEQLADIRGKAWATRRERYGKAGHR